MLWLSRKRLVKSAKLNSTEHQKQGFVERLAELDPTEKKICGKCQELMPANSNFFCVNKSSQDGLYSCCHNCRRLKLKRLDGFTRCRKCLDLKPAEKFEGNRTTCRSCRSRASYLSSDKEKASLRHKEWRLKNKDRHNESGRKWKANNKEKHAKYNKEWAFRNPALVRAKDHRRRCTKLKATPSWFDKRKADLVYLEAIRLEVETGVKHEVDHIVPLQGKYVCGLHVHYNLRAIPKSKNRSKGNRMEAEL